MKKIILLLLGIFLCGFSFAQQRIVVRPFQKPQPTTNTYNKDSIIVVQAIIEGKDTVLTVNLPEVSVYGYRFPETKREIKKYEKLIRHVKKAYPYAKLAGIKFREYERLLLETNNENQKNALMKQAEKNITDQFSGELKNFTFTQGRILIKLVDRETGNTSYNLLKDLRGSFRAFFYQGFARIWGYNLKTNYDPQTDEEDAKIESIIQMIEAGLI
ncbi:MAG: DUF4294 domain-containing protein [Lentimicrobiaceae bacterium]|jgi:hypothetical protein|nr:DUF4294 domain-containing protein [Lentimicrobiaceae bacterium]